MFQSSLIYAIAFGLVTVTAFQSSSNGATTSTRLSMTRLKMALIKIPLTSNCISNEIIDDDHFCLNNSSGRKPFMGGNWKLNPRTLSASTTLVAEVQLINYIIIYFYRFSISN